MTSAYQATSEDQVVDSIMEELEAYVDAVKQLELKNRDYRPMTYKAPTKINHGS